MNSGGERSRAEAGIGDDLAEFWCSAEVKNGGCFKEFVYGGVRGEDVVTSFEDAFDFREARIVDGVKGAGVVVMDEFRGPDGMRKEGSRCAVLGWPMREGWSF